MMILLLLLMLLLQLLLLLMMGSMMMMMMWMRMHMTMPLHQLKKKGEIRLDWVGLGWIGLDLRKDWILRSGN